MEHLDFRKRVRFSAPENATSPESDLLRRLVSNLKKLDDLGLADDYIKRAVLEKFSRESNAGEFGHALHAGPPIQFDVDNNTEGARRARRREPEGTASDFANPIAKQAFEHALKSQPEKVQREVEVSTTAPVPADAPALTSLNGSPYSESVFVADGHEFNQTESEQMLSFVTDNTPAKENRSPEARIPKNFQVM